jgi:hypothetical protein
VATNASPETAPRWLTQWLPLALILLLIAIYFGFVERYAINVPLGDDIYDVLQVLTGLEQAPDLKAAADLVYAQHNDHRTLSSRLVYLASYQLTGEIDFRTLTILANLALPLFLLLFLSMSREHPLPLVILLPAALFLLQLRAYGITFWSMAAFAYHYVFLYGFAAIYCLHRVTPLRFVAAVLLATLATYSLASGQAVWLVGLAGLLHQWLLRKSCGYGYPLLWTICALLVLWFWRVGLETPNTLLAMLANFFQSPGHHIIYTLTLLGNAASEHSVALAAMTGFAMLAVTIVCSMGSWRNQDLRLVLCCWLIVLSVAAVVLGRAPYSTVDYALSSRYSFPSVLMLATCWVTLAVSFRLRHWMVLGAAVMLAGGYYTYSWQTYPGALEPYLEKRVRNFNKGKYWAWARPMKESNGIVAEAVSLGIYQPPPRPLPMPQITRVRKPQPPAKEKQE